MAEGEISISGALSFAWTLLSQNWRAIWGALALNALSWTVLFAGMFAAQPSLMLAGSAAFIITNYPLYGAIFRIAAHPAGKDDGDKLGDHGIQWRSMELRILLADVLIFVLQLIIGLLVVFALLAPVVAMVYPHAAQLKGSPTREDIERLLGPQASQAVQLIPIAAWAVLLFIKMRLFLALPASGLSGSMAVLRTWRLTRGSFWRIFVCYFVVQLPMMVTSVLVSAAVSGELAGLTPAQIFGYSILSGLLAGAASTPLTAGLEAYFYQRLGPVPDRKPEGNGPG
jgi:hypothetical protein